MKNKVELIIENNQEIILIDKAWEKIIEDVVAAVLEYEAFDENVEVGVTLVDNEQIREINREHRHKDTATDVLSFPMLEFDEQHHLIETYEAGDYNYDEDVRLLGDIVISLERAKEQAGDYGHSMEREIGFLTVHSMFHLLGYDHEDEEQAQVMRQKEEEVLQRLALTR